MNIRRALLTKNRRFNVFWSEGVKYQHFILNYYFYKLLISYYSVLKEKFDIDITSVIDGNSSVEKRFYLIYIL